MPWPGRSRGARLDWERFKADVIVGARILEVGADCDLRRGTISGRAAEFESLLTTLDECLVKWIDSCQKKKRRYCPSS
jgi:hypothetical protein